MEALSSHTSAPGFQGSGVNSLNACERKCVIAQRLGNVLTLLWGSLVEYHLQPRCGGTVESAKKWSFG